MSVPRRPHAAVLLLAGCLVATLATGVTYAASSSSKGFKACADPSGQLALLSKHHKCAKGYSEVALGASGARGERGATGPAGLDGRTGPSGSSGPAGAAGANGNTILNGSGAPANSVGAVGDFYLDTTNEILYGPKVGEGCNPLPCRSAWPASGTPLKGAPGPQGPSGQGPAYDTTGAADLPNGQPATLATLTLPTAGDYTVTADAKVVHVGNDDTAWYCSLDAANPGHASVNLDTDYLNMKGDSPESIASIPLLGVVDIAAGGTVSVSCGENQADKSDTASVDMVATQVSSLTTS